MLQYTNLKNVLTSYEYLLKSLAGGAYPNVGGKELTAAVRQVLKTESWMKLFNGDDVILVGSLSSMGAVPNSS